ncbi:hypothetical protein [Streptomyces niveus]
MGSCGRELQLPAVLMEIHRSGHRPARHGRSRKPARRGAPGGSRGKWFVLLAWLILALALGPLAGKLGEVEETGPNAFLAPRP